MTAHDNSARAAQPAAGSALEVFRVFLKLGLTSFGGPIAHLGYFRDELVVRRKWIDEEGYADLVALCQFLPGPASSGLDSRSVSCAAMGCSAVSPHGSLSRCRRSQSCLPSHSAQRHLLELLRKACCTA